MLQVVLVAGARICIDCITFCCVAGVGSALVVLHVVRSAGVQINLDCITCCCVAGVGSSLTVFI